MKLERIIKNSVLFLVYVCFGPMCPAQTEVPWFGKINWYSGFSQEISGENLSYFSAYPDYATMALLTRATDGEKVIEWVTDTLPRSVKGKYIYFSWVAAHSSGTSKGPRNFDLYINDGKVLTFTTYPDHQHPDWYFAAPDSTAIVFHQTKRDGANDAHGLAYLRVPLAKITPGKPVKLKIVGQAQHSNDWFMTFKFSFKEKVDIEPMPFLLKDGRQPVMLTALHFGKPSRFNVVVNGKDCYEFQVQNGVNNFDIPVAAVRHRDSVKIEVSVGKQQLINQYVVLQPVRYRELDLIHHAHTDIGYSHLQPDVVKIHNQNIDDALQMIEATKDFPADAKFKWNIESLWVVENYLRQANLDQKNRFISAVKDGSIGLSALYANMLTGLSAPEEMFHYTEYAGLLEQEYGLNIPSAMISDIPGYAWTTVTALAKGGVRYFSSGPNYMGETHPFLGDRVGFFVKNWGDKPVWWVSPSGDEKVLFWTAGKGYSSWHGTAPGGVFDRGTKRIAAYLRELDAKKYPYDLVQWRYNIVADNGPIDSSISRFVTLWNEKYSSPRLVLNTTEKLFEAFEHKYGDQLPVVKGDITPYWEDGAISSANEEGRNRKASTSLSQLATLYSVMNPEKFKAAQFYSAWSDILLFHEHTWGAFNSTSEPDLPFVQEQWRIKQQYVADAERQIDSLQAALLQSVVVSNARKILVCNTTSWSRTGPVVVHSTASGNSVRTATGALLPLQRLENGDITFIATDVPPLGCAVFEITDEKVKAGTSSFTITDSTLSNGILSIAWDKKLGSITALSASDRVNLVSSFKNQGLNSYWYVPGLNPADAQTNDAVQVRLLQNGPVVATLSITSGVPGANLLERRISLYAGGDAVWLENIVDKKSVRTKESIHFGFPFCAQLNHTRLDAGYGTMNYPADQLPGSNADYVYGRRWMDVSSAERGLQLMMDEAPLLEPGEMVDERLLVNKSLKSWKSAGAPATTWFSYVMDNYWHTNYKADQSGFARFRYCLRPHGDANSLLLEQAAQEFDQPLVAIPVADRYPVPKGLFELSNPRIVVTNVTPLDDGAFKIRLFNPGFERQQTGFVWKAIKPVSITDRANRIQLSGSDAVSISPMGVNEYLVK